MNERLKQEIEFLREDLSPLVGATITRVEVVPDPHDDYQHVLRLHVKFKGTVNHSQRGVYEVWMDEEGNGPGHLAYTGPSLSAA